MLCQATDISTSKPHLQDNKFRWYSIVVSLLSAVDISRYFLQTE